MNASKYKDWIHAECKDTKNQHSPKFCNINGISFARSKIHLTIKLTFQPKFYLSQIRNLFFFFKTLLQKWFKYFPPYNGNLTKLIQFVFGNFYIHNLCLFTTSMTMRSWYTSCLIKIYFHKNTKQRSHFHSMYPLVHF